MDRPRTPDAQGLTTRARRARRWAWFRGLLLGIALGAGVVLLRSWGEDRIRALVREPASPHEKYADALRDAGLEGTAVGRGWLAAADSALLRAVDVALPHREAGYFAAERTEAVAFRWRVARGRRVVVELDTAARGARLFVDLFALSGDSVPRPERVASLDDGSRRLEYEPRRDVTLVLRLQPEMLGAVRWTLTVRSDPTLAFPVAGRDLRAALSRWGAARDAGRRRHEGIDIFAPRGTPVVAAAPGTVSGRTQNALGGKVVWVRAEGGPGLYYAHLDSQLVRPGDRVEVGDTLGLVGNTGNARGTPPHLHFGVYLRGAVDPVAFLEPSPPVPPIRADGAALGGLVRLARAETLQPAPRSGESAQRRLVRGTLMRVDGATRDAYRVRLPDGATGYVSAAATADTSPPLGEAVVRRAPLTDRPVEPALVVADDAEGSFPIVGVADGAVLLRLPDGRTGWLRESPAPRPPPPPDVARDARGGGA